MIGAPVVATLYSRGSAGSSYVDVQPSVLPLYLVLTSLVACVGLAAIALGWHEGPERHNTIAVWCGVAVLMLVASARYALRLPWMSASIVYLLLFWMFHYGLAFTAVVFPDVLTSPPMLTAWMNWEVDVGWLFWPNVNLSLILGLIGAAGFLSGLVITAGVPHGRHVSALRSEPDATLYRVGWMVLLAGLGVTLVGLVADGGFEALFMGYQGFRLALLDLRLQIAIHVAHLGCLMAICGARDREWVTPLALWTLLLGIPMLVLGLRNEALIPLISFALVLAYGGVRLPRGVLLTSAAITMIVIPAVRVIRDVGFANRSLVSWTEVSALDTFTEMGGTLRAVKAYVDRIEEGDEYLLGASYWAPFDRQVLTRLLPTREPVPYDDDVRVPGRLLPTTEGAVGTAATGEAYYNFGPVGPLIYFTSVGLLFGWLERRAAASRYGCAALGIVTTLFYFNIRSEWIQVPAQTGFGLALLGCCYIWERFITGARTGR